MEKAELINIKYDENIILNKRKLLRKEFTSISSNIKSGRITSIGEEDLKLLFNLYDKYFFNNYFRNNFFGRIKFSLSKRMSKSAGKTIIPRNNIKLPEEKQIYEIRIGVNFLFQYYELIKEKFVVGIKTIDALHALILVFEHELIHFIEFYVFSKSSCKNSQFKTIANNIFGHKGVYHSLPTNSEIISNNSGLMVGDKVTFIYNKQNKNGFIYRINKRAVVMILDSKGNYVDKLGKRYSKFYVPLDMLSKL